MCFFATGCGGGLKLNKGPVDPPHPALQARLAAIVIPDPPGMTLSALEVPLEIISLQEFEEVSDPFPKMADWTLWEKASFLASLGKAGNKNPNPSVVEIPAMFSESIPPETGGILPAEIKRPPAHPRSAKATGHPAGNESSFRDPWAENVMNSPLTENSSPAPLPGEGSFPLGSNLPEAPSRLPEFSSQPEEKVLGPALTRETSLELPGPGAKISPSDAAVNTFPSLLNEKVQDFIAFFQGRAESFFSRSLTRSQAYEEMMKRIFREKNLPEELFYLALIESGYSPTALSRAKASGIWQFISQTAKRFGLRVDKWVDERRDPEKSTLAAAAYLKTLYGMFNCWDLATAGYNAGEGKVLLAMKKAQSENFWEISKHRYLKQETKQYVPMFLAAMTIAKEPQKYGFSNIAYLPPLVYEKVAVPPSTSLALIAKAAETDLSEIHSLNPALLREKTPPNLPPFEINLPPGKREVFEKNFPSLCRSSASKNTYRVRSGDTLSHLAKKYNVSVQELCGANALMPQSLLKLGSILKIPQ